MNKKSEKFVDESEQVEEDSADDQSEIKKRVSMVAMSTGRSFAMLILFGIFIAVILYLILFGGNGKQEYTQERVTPEQQKAAEKLAENAAVLAKPVEASSITRDINIATNELPPLLVPEPPRIKEMHTPLPFAEAIAENMESEDEEKEMNFTDFINTSYFTSEQEPKTTTKKRRKTGNATMVVYGGGSKSPASSSASDSDDEDEKEQERLHINFNQSMQPTSAANTTATYFGKLSNMVLQGQIIEIILETNINTDLDGVLRGFISRDVLSADGANILIPKGSTAIGRYAANVSFGQSRINIAWNRVIRPDGIDIMINSVGIDSFGRTGIAADVIDNKFMGVMKNAIMLSSITLGSSLILSNLTDSDSNVVVTETTDGDKNTVSTAGSPTDIAIKDINTDVSKILKDYIQKFDDFSRPTMLVHAGTVMKALVNQDLIFANSVAKRYKPTRNVIRG